MSNAVESAEESSWDSRSAKKQKCFGTKVFGGPMDDEETARKKLKEVGFDPERPDHCKRIAIDGKIDPYVPMVYFCTVGDLGMCRYLYSKGASTYENWWDATYDLYIGDSTIGIEEEKMLNSVPTPMYAAARGGHLEICKWLYEVGGWKDIRWTSTSFDSTLCIAVSCISKCADPTERERQREICRWLILKEALCPCDNGVISGGLLKEAFRRCIFGDEAPYFLGWAEDAVQTHDGFMAFLTGTYLRDVPAFTKEGFDRMIREKFRSSGSAFLITASLSRNQQQYMWENEHRRSSCVLQCLSGHPGIRKHIADILGVVRGRDLRILRELEEGLLHLNGRWGW